MGRRESGEREVAQWQCPATKAHNETCVLPLHEAEALVGEEQGAGGRGKSLMAWEGRGEVLPDLK